MEMFFVFQPKIWTERCLGSSAKTQWRGTTTTKLYQDFAVARERFANFLQAPRRWQSLNVLFVGDSTCTVICLLLADFASAMVREDCSVVYSEKISHRFLVVLGPRGGGWGVQVYMRDRRNMQPLRGARSVKGAWTWAHMGNEVRHTDLVPSTVFCRISSSCNAHSCALSHGIKQGLRPQACSALDG
jgi:hypothetical protein